MQNREIGTRAFAGVGHGHADGSGLPLPGLAEEKRETGDGHQVATRLPNHRPGREKNLENLEAWRRQQTGSQLPSSPGRRHALSHAGREGGPLVAASARVQWKMENGKLGRRSNTQQSGAGNRRQRLVRHIPGHSEGFSAPSAANDRACLLRWASTARAKKLQVGPRRLPPHPSRTTWSCSIWLPREEPLPRNNLHSKDLEGASGKEREMAGSHES